MTTSDIWIRLLDKALARRIREDEFYELAKQLHCRSPILGVKLADVVISRQKLIPQTLDPLIPVYAETLLEHKRLSSADLLNALYRHSRSSKLKGSNADDDETSQDVVFNTCELEITIFDAITRAYLPPGASPRTQDETRIILAVLSEWLNANVARGTVLAEETNHQVLVDEMAVFESFGTMCIAILENQRVIGVIDHALNQNAKKSLAGGLTSFVTFWTTAAPQHAQNTARLEMAQKARGLVDQTSRESEEVALDVNAAVQVDSVVDLQSMHTRPAMFVFINALLTGRPLTDENMMMNFLHNRYEGDTQSLASDLIVAAFDVLAAVTGRSEPNEIVFGYKAFLTSKIPLLLNTLTGSLLNPEFPIQSALARIDLELFPTVGLGMLQTNTALQDMRQDFVYACILHGLLTADSVGRFLGDATFDSPPTPQNRYHKNLLLQQCGTEPGKAVQLIEQLEKLDGNAGAIVGAVTELIRTACAAKDTMSLKSICTTLSGKPHLLDAVLQFVSPASILQPLCQLLDSWKYEDDQGESQPVYDEFASVFLLVLISMYRYQFSPAEVGIAKESFVAKYVTQNHKSYLGSELSEEQSRHLGNWVKGLYDPEGMTEEVTASCQPQQFYMLVPTIFSQTLLACSAGVLSIDTIKSGLEYLSEPFLLPSLIDAIYWLSSYVRENPGIDTDIVVQILQRLTRTPSSTETQPMHATIMAIVALPLMGSIRILRRFNPKQNHLDSIIKSFKPHFHFRRGALSPCSELATWTSAPNDLGSSTKLEFSRLIDWNLQATTLNAAQRPPHYNHRLFLITELLLGAPALLQILLAEVKEQTDNPAGAAAVAIDIAAAIICAPKCDNSPIEVGWITSPVPAQPSNHSKRLNLRNALMLEFERATEIWKNDQTMAESVVRLHRRVEAQSTIPVVPLPDMNTQLPVVLLDDTGLGLPQNTSAPGQSIAVMDFSTDPILDIGMGDLTTGDSMQVDLSAGDDAMSLLGGTGGLGGDDDVFGDLDMSNIGDMDFGF